MVLVDPALRLAFSLFVADEKSLWWQSVIHTLLSLPLCVLLRAAYPPHELPQRNARTRSAPTTASRGLSR
eukprot:3848118-Pleurochrysis_carterae.AAC.1